MIDVCSSTLGNTINWGRILHFNTCWSMKAEKTIALGVLAKNQTSNLKYSELLSYLSSKDNVRINYALRWKNILSKTKISPSG